MQYTLGDIMSKVMALGTPKQLLAKRVGRNDTGEVMTSIVIIVSLVWALLKDVVALYEEDSRILE